MRCGATLVLSADLADGEGLLSYSSIAVALGHRNRPLKRTFELREFAYGMAFSPNGTHFVTGGTYRTPKLWDVATGHVVRSFEGSAARVRSVAFSPDGAHVVFASSDSTLKLWDRGHGPVDSHISRGTPALSHR